MSAFRRAFLGTVGRRLHAGALAATGAATGLAAYAASPIARSEASLADDNAPAAEHPPGTWSSWMGFAPPKAALSATEWRPLKLSSVTWKTHDTVLLRFNFPKYWDVSGMECASYLLARAPCGSLRPDGTRAFVVRPYTPSHVTVGYLELVIKVYEDGKLSRYIGNLRRGSTMDFRGPIMKLPIVENQYEQVGLVAGGTGITPMLQVAKRILLNPTDTTKVSLLYGSKTEDDIILREEIDELARQHPDQFQVTYVLDTPPAGWTGGSGHMSTALLREKLPAASSPNSKVLVCGPPGMMKAVSGPMDYENKENPQGPLEGQLKEIGFVASQVCKF